MYWKNGTPLKRNFISLFSWGDLKTWPKKSIQSHLRRYEIPQDGTGECKLFVRPQFLQYIWDELEGNGVTRVWKCSLGSPVLSTKHAASLSLLSNCQAQKSRNFLLCSKAQGSTRNFFQRAFYTPITNKSVFGAEFVESTAIIAEDLCVFRLIRSLVNQHRPFGGRGCSFRGVSSEISLIKHNTQRREF